MDCEWKVAIILPSYHMWIANCETAGNRPVMDAEGILGDAADDAAYAAKRAIHDAGSVTITHGRIITGVRQ